MWPKLKFLFLVGLLCPTLELQAFGPGVTQVRSGMVMGNVSGGDNLSGSVTTVPYIDVEYSIMQGSAMSFAFRGILAPDLEAVDLNYAYVGVGQRFYFGGPGVFVSRSEGSAAVKIKPGVNFFAGWDAGMSHMIIGRVGDLSIASTALDAGITFGTNWYLTNSVAAQAGFTSSYALGVTTIAASGLILKGFIGVSF